MSSKFDVCVRGAGVVGLTTALLLARERLRVALVASASGPDPVRDIRAFALNAASRAVLDTLRAWPPGDAATPMTAMRIREGAGAVADAQLDFDATDVAGEPLGWIVDVPALIARLQDAVDFQGGIERVDQPPGPVPLTVVCEGRRSATRQTWGLEFDVRPYPHTAVAARLRCEQPHGGIARQWFVGGEVMAWLPMEGSQGNLVALVWSVPHERAAQLLALNPEDFAQAVMSHTQSALGTLTVQGQPAGWPLELSRARRWFAAGHSAGGAGSVVLAGDAAHAMHPLAGQGLNVGLADAAELARVLAAREHWRSLGDARLLRRYERARAADVATMGAVTDGLFGLFNHADSRVLALRQWGLGAFSRSGPLKSWVARRAMGAAHPL